MFPMVCMNIYIHGVHPFCWVWVIHVVAITNPFLGNLINQLIGSSFSTVLT